ncbi:MAG: hypothetical protein ACMG6S_32295 [Byssovorax sp.]
MLSIEDPMGRGVSATWAPHHELASYTNGEHHTTTFEDDGLGRILSSRDAGARFARARRDVMERITYLECADSEKLQM